MTDKNSLVRFTYNEFAKREIKSRFIFDDWNHLDKFTGQLAEKAKILDIGCGNGLPVDKYLTDKGYEVLGVDISDEQIKRARQNVPKAKFATMDMEELTLPIKSFDGALLLFSLFHLPRGIHQEILTSVNELLVSGGYLLITLGLKELETTHDEFEDLKLFWSQWDKAKNLTILGQSGFSLLYEEIHGVGDEDHIVVLARKQ